MSRVQRCACGRPAFAGGRCRSHYRRGDAAAIRPKRAAVAGGIRKWGFVWAPETLEVLLAVAEERGVAGSALVAEVVDAWAGRQRRKKRGRR